MLVFLLYCSIRTIRMRALVRITLQIIGIAVLAIVVSLGVQLYLSQTLGVEGMIMGALAGLIVLFVSGVMKRDEADSLITDGMVLMAFIGFVMLVAAGFSNVLTKTGDVESLVKTSAGFIGHSQSLGALLMLISLHFHNKPCSL